ncbi:MAG: sugar phosphate nucleotidyltransferase [Eubacteriales bacterium]|nr:sugar phosphate nucleotidyltransferase [Eubacteriales bacterium]
MKETALVIMAAGIGSRFGGGIKQLAKLGPHGEIIIDYSIHDALKAGFSKIIFIIRKDIEADFREIIGDRISKIANVQYAFQALDDLPAGFSVPEGRKKPWGTGHAILAARDLIDCPFAVINADDFYGAEGFQKVHDYLVNDMDERGNVMDLCMAGYILGNTLSENGAVTRGVCEVNDDSNLKSVSETFEIRKENGMVVGQDGNGEPVKLSEDDIVSMNMWGLTPRFVKTLEERFPAFLRNAQGNIKAEYLLPQVIGDLLQEGNATVKVLPTADRWFGVTYAEDRESVERSLQELHNKGVYGDSLFG